MCQSTAFGIWSLLFAVCCFSELLNDGFGICTIVLWTPVPGIRRASIYHRNRFAFRILVSVTVWINYNAVLFRCFCGGFRFATLLGHSRSYHVPYRNKFMMMITLPIGHMFDKRYHFNKLKNYFCLKLDRVLLVFDWLISHLHSINFTYYLRGGTIPFHDGISFFWIHAKCSKIHRITGLRHEKTIDFVACHAKDKLMDANE